ncbi:MAG TPA: ATP-binding protein [Solirubrobacteraceae bacterium]
MSRRLGLGRLPLRVRLTAAFASVVAVVLAGSGVLIYSQFKGYVDARVAKELSERSVAFRGLAAREVLATRIIALSGERFAQIYGPDGEVIAATRALTGRRLLTRSELQTARRRPVFATRAAVSPGADDLRLLAFTSDRGEVAVVAESLDVRERELQRLAILLLISLPGALLLASVAGYQVARAAMRPVERMRARAALISDRNISDRLPEPQTGDELARLAQTLNHLLGRLQAAIEHQRQLIGDASHELRTPISVLRTRLDVAARDTNADEASLRLVLEQARADANRLARLADDLLVLARSDQGALPLRLEPLDIQDVLEAAAARQQSAAGQQQRTISTSVLIDGGAVVMADADRIAQVLDNLVINSLRYGAGTTALIARAAEDSARLEVLVTDHGNGFPAGFAPRAFDRFSQGDETRGRGGSGLGLAIVAAIVHAHGETPTAGNHPDGGAQVRFTLPLA